jgi:hypothetical protein
LADCDWTDAQKDEFTKALWQIVLNFVDFGWGFHPVQQASAISTTTLVAESPSVVSSEFNSNNNIREVADVLAARSAEEK